MEIKLYSSKVISVSAYEVYQLSANSYSREVMTGVLSTNGIVNVFAERSFMQVFESIIEGRMTPDNLPDDSDIDGSSKFFVYPAV